MNPTELPLHPALVHLPLGLAFAMPFVAIALLVTVWKGVLPRRAFAIAVGLQLLLAAGAFAAMQAGHAAEKAAEAVAPDGAIHEHEEAGERVVWGAAVVLALSLGAYLAPARRVPLAAALFAAGTLVVAAFAVDAGRKGGALVYRYGAAVSGAGAHPGPAGQPPGGDDHDHD